MNEIYNFSAGPATLPKEVLKKAAAELVSYKDTGISMMETSHRSNTFEKVLHHAKSTMMELMNINKDYEILFLQGGASMQFAMVPLNLLSTGGRADYINTGSFAQKAIDEAKKIGDANVIASSKNDGYTYIPKEYKINKDSVYLHITSNNTIEGTVYKELPKSFIPIVADMSSNILSEPIDVSKYGIIYAGAQKNLGPAGVTVVIIRKDLIREDLKIANILRYKTFADKDSMYNTPPTYSIYMLGLVLDWIKKQGGLKEMQKRNIYKAELIYKYLDKSKLFVSNIKKEDRSIMNVTFTTNDEQTDKKFIKEANKEGLCSIKGHRSVGGMRASIYNAMPLEGVKKLVDFMTEFEKNL